MSVESVAPLWQVTGDLFTAAVRSDKENKRKKEPIVGPVSCFLWQAAAAAAALFVVVSVICDSDETQMTEEQK